MENTQTIKNILLFFMFVLIFFLMIQLKALLIPLAMALMSALLFNPTIIYLQKKKIPKWASIPLILIGSLVIMNFLGVSVVNTVNEIAVNKEYFLNRLVTRLDSILLSFKYSIGYNVDITNVNQFLHNIITTQFVSSLLSDIAGGVSSFAGSFIIFLIYYIIFLIGMSDYRRFLSYVSGDIDDKPVLKSFDRIQNALVYYIKYKSFINLGTAFVYTLILFFFDIKFFMFFGILAFFLNFIPNFGALIATVLAVAMGLIQLDNPNTVLFLLVCILGSNFVIGSVIEPKLMGDRLKLNIIAVIFGLLFWGYIWGLPGMFLSVPLTVIIKIIFENFENLSVFGRLLGYPEKKTITIK